MLLAVRISSYECTWEVWRALKKLELPSTAPRATLTHFACYYLIHNWIPKEGLLLISNEPFFFVSDNEEANHMKSYLHLGKPMSTNEAQRTKNVA